MAATPMTVEQVLAGPYKDGNPSTNGNRQLAMLKALAAAELPRDGDVIEALSDANRLIEYLSGPNFGKNSDKPLSLATRALTVNFLVKIAKDLNIPQDVFDRDRLVTASRTWTAQNQAVQGEGAPPRRIAASPGVKWSSLVDLEREWRDGDKRGTEEHAVLALRTLLAPRRDHDLVHMIYVVGDEPVPEGHNAIRIDDDGVMWLDFPVYKSVKNVGRFVIDVDNARIRMERERLPAEYLADSERVLKLFPDIKSLSGIMKAYFTRYGIQPGDKVFDFDEEHMAKKNLAITSHLPDCCGLLINDWRKLWQQWLDSHKDTLSPNQLHVYAWAVGHLKSADVHYAIVTPPAPVETPVETPAAPAADPGAGPSRLAELPVKRPRSEAGSGDGSEEEEDRNYKAYRYAMDVISDAYEVLMVNRPEIAKNILGRALNA